MKTLLIILGTRPEAIKLAPVILELRKNPNYNVLVCNTEQQKELSNQTLSFFNIEANFNLDVMTKNQSLSTLQSRILTKLTEIFSEHSINATIVQGDTMSVFSGALASFYHKVPVFHVEAGLRSHDLFEPFPEEALRQMVSRIANIHFAPTTQNVKTLLSEGISKEKIILTGNTVIDALLRISSVTLKEAKKGLDAKGVHNTDKLVLITIHRRENHGERLTTILKALFDIIQKYPDHQFILPVHPNPNVKDQIYNTLSSQTNVLLLPPLNYPELVYLMQKTKLIVTDSGGIQEEAPTFGNPVLVLRYETERKESIDAGVAKLIGANSQKIYEECSKILDKDKAATRIDSTRNPYGDGTASLKIAQAINNFFAE